MKSEDLRISGNSLDSSGKIAFEHQDVSAFICGLQETTSRKQKDLSEPRFRNEVGTKQIGLELRDFLRRMLRHFLKSFGPLFFGPKKSRQIPAEFPALKCLQCAQGLG